MTAGRPAATQRTPPAQVRRNAWLLAASIVATFALLRASLYLSPDADFNVGRYNVHHLFTGLLLITLGGVPLALFRGRSRRLDAAVVVFGVGLGMALDEWVYLIATDGSNASYLLPVSLWGGVIAVSLACAYAAAMALYRRRKGS
jgi:hypothetical protein